MTSKPQSKSKVPKVKGKIDSLQYVESVFVNRKPIFLVTNIETGQIYLSEEFEVEGKIIRPLEKNECGYIPYSLSKEELDDLTKSPISTEKLLIELNDVIDTYVAASEDTKILILGEILITYSQEWISTLHYPFFVGETESGKSTILHLGKHLNYRCLYSEDIPHADIYNFLGEDEEGTGTICEDEAQDLWKDKPKIRTYKSSYSKGSSKPIVKMLSNSKYQVYYKTFCAKWFAGETVPHDKGFNERLAIVHMTGGIPKMNIKRLSEKQLAELNHLRNKLLIWKMQQMSKSHEYFGSGLTGRDQELWEDFLRIFDNSWFAHQAKSVVEYYVNQRHNSIKNSFEARIFKILCDNLNENNEIESKAFWETLTVDNPDLPGNLDSFSGKSFYLDEFGFKLSPNTLARIIEDKFQGKKHSRIQQSDGKSKKITYYVFDPEVIKSLSSKYRIES